MIENIENITYGREDIVEKYGKNDRGLKISQIHVKKRMLSETVLRSEATSNSFSKIAECISILLVTFSLFGVVSAAQITDVNHPVIAFVADARPIIGSDINVLKGDFDQIIPQSPMGYVDATVMGGDMNHISSGSTNTDGAYALSTARNIPDFFVLGNHELGTAIDLPVIRSKFNSYTYSPNPGPAGSRETTYSFDVGNIHVIVINEYWDGNANGNCDWNVPPSGLNTDDGCMKYSSTDGGYIPDALYNWIENDLNNNKKSWTVVAGHEPLYPWGRHTSDSLNKDTANRDKLENLFISKNVTAFIGGHTHVSGIQTIDNIFHANDGVLGDNVGTEAGGDNFATITYTYVDANGNFVIEEKYENPTWSNPGSIKFTKVPKTTYQLGDVNKDGNITIADALLYLRKIVGQDISPFSVDTSDDVTCDGSITIADALLVLKKSVDPNVKLGC